jgi:hypothetical protein
MLAIFAATAGLAAFALAGPAAAGDRCKGEACYHLVTTPPVYEHVHEQVLVAPARAVKRKVPALLQDITEEVVVRPERTIARHIPAEYGTVAEKLLVEPAGRKWVVRHDAHGKLVGCWVKTKPVYALRHRSVIVKPARVVHETLPAITKTRTRTVVLEPARVEVDHVPARYETRTRRVKVAEGHVAWAPARKARSCGRGLFTTGCH